MFAKWQRLCRLIFAGSHPDPPPPLQKNLSPPLQPPLHSPVSRSSGGRRELGVRGRGLRLLSRPVPISWTGKVRGGLLIDGPGDQLVRCWMAVAGLRIGGGKRLGNRVRTYRTRRDVSSSGAAEAASAYLDGLAAPLPGLSSRRRNRYSWLYGHANASGPLLEPAPIATHVADRRVAQGRSVPCPNAAQASSSTG